MINLKTIITEKTNEKILSDKEISSMIEKSFKLLRIPKDELEGWSKESKTSYFIKGEFNEGITIYKSPDKNKSWVIGIENQHGNIKKLKNLPNTLDKIKEIIEDYQFDIGH